MYGCVGEWKKEQWASMVTDALREVATRLEGMLGFRVKVTALRETWYMKISALSATQVQVTKES